MAFSIGHLERPTGEDRQFDTREEAEIAAIEESYDDGVRAVWDNDSGEILAIVYQQTVYTS